MSGRILKFRSLCPLLDALVLAHGHCFSSKSIDHYDSKNLQVHSDETISHDERI